MSSSNIYSKYSPAKGVGLFNLGSSSKQHQCSRGSKKHLKAKDIVSAQNSIKKLAKQAVEGLKSQAAQIDREIEHEVVFEWVV